MFVGHYAAALAAKAAEPRAPLWLYVTGCQLLDIGWAGLIMTGAEKVRAAPDLPGAPFDFYQMPWTHSLPAAVVWSVGTALAVRFLLRLPWRAAIFLGLTIFSHWPLDLLVHRPDLLLWPGAPKVGLGLWDQPIPEQGLEVGLLAVTAVFWTAQRAGEGRRAGPAAAFVALLLMLQFAGFLPLDANPVSMGLMSWLAFAVAGFGAWLTDRRPPPLLVSG